MDAKPVRVLIVDDRAADRALVARALASADFPVEVAEADSLQAVRALLAGPAVDAVLTDYDLGAADGIEIFNLVRASWPETPVMFVTVSGSEETAIEALRHGVDDYVLKNDSLPSNLPLRLQKVLSRAAYRREAAAAANWRQVVLDALPARIVLLDGHGIIQQTNGRWNAYAKQAGDTTSGPGDDYLAACERAATHGDADAAVVLRQLRGLLAGDLTEFVHEYPCVEPERPDAWYEMRATRAGGGHRGAVIAHFDITDHRRSEAEVNLAANAFAHTAEAIVVLDDAFNVVKANSAFTVISGYDLESVSGKPLSIFATELNEPEVAERMTAELARSGSWDGELWGRRSGGETFPMLIGLNQLVDAKGARTQYVGVISDISQHREYERRLDYLLHYDALTSLPNRFQLQQRIEDAMVRARRNGSQVGMLFVDLSAFKTFNDSLGMAVGDLLLQTVAGRLTESLREVDVLARVGGDVFAILVEDDRAAKIAGMVAEKVLAAIEVPMQLQGHEVVVSASAGIACFPDDASDVDDLLRAADTALHKAKSAGPGTIQFFAAEMNAHALEALVLQASLRAALDQDQLFLQYQPIMAMSGDRVLGVEALVRWKHPELGIIPPDRFIPIAEESGLIVRLGEWVLREALHTAAQWRTHGIQLGYVAVNLSMRQFRDPGLADMIADALKETGCPPPVLRIELTESMLSDNPAVARDVLDKLHALGIEVAIDDFGTGYSSLSYLKAFPLDVLKIDRSFVKDTPGDADDVAIVRAIISLAHTLGFNVVAEGVETVAQQALLAEAGCDSAQGYLFSRPLAADACEQFLTAVASTVPRSREA